MTVSQLKALLEQRFAGVLKSGKHQEDGEACAMELVSVARGIPWTDNPGAVRSFDLRSINDIDVSDAIRTKHLLPVIVAYDGSLDWPKSRKIAVVSRISMLTVQKLIASLPGLTSDHSAACRAAETLTPAGAAADAAAYAAGAAAGAAADAAAYAASAAARAAAYAASDAPSDAAARAAAYAAGAAAYAAGAAADAAADAAAYAADAADAAAYAAARAAARAAVFEIACSIWLEAAGEPGL